jgi:hypothetical protein
MATSDLLTIFGTPVTFSDSGSTAVITLNNLAANTGRVSAQVDRGAGAIPTWFTLRGTFQKGVAGVVDEVIWVYIITFNAAGTHGDGEVGASDAALTAVQAKNIPIRFPVFVPFTSTNTDFTASYPPFEIASRYFSVGVLNSLTGLLRAVANSCVITLTPVNMEAQ